MIGFIRTLHNRRPLLWTVVAFIVVVALAATMSTWWSYLLVQNDRIVTQMTAAASQAEHDNFPLAILMVLGILSMVVIVLGLLYMFLRLIRALQLNLAQSQFIAAVTHELRSPVASLQLMLDTIRDPGTPPEKRREFEQCMSADLLRLRSLVDQVLETARLENFTTVAPTEPVAVDTLVRTCVEAVETRLRVSGGRVELGDLKPGTCVSANRGLLTSALVSVLDNAIKYSEGAAEISVDVRPEGKSVIVEVRDRGIGISRKEQKRIFRRFYRARDPISKAKPGTGLGLYFARLALKAQGGDISVHSPGLGQGTTIRIEVPRA